MTRTSSQELLAYGIIDESLRSTGKFGTKPVILSCEFVDTLPKEVRKFVFGSNNLTIDVAKDDELKVVLRLNVENKQENEVEEKCPADNRGNIKDDLEKCVK